MYAVIETGGKQYRVAEGDIIYVEKLDAAAEETVTFDKVLVVGTDNKTEVGSPLVKGASVEGKIIKQGKAKKVIVFTYRPKKGSKRKKGHRQLYTKVEITAVKA